MKKRSFAGLITGVAIAVMLAPSASATLSSDALRAPSPRAVAAACEPAWSADTVYLNGDVASFGGQNWTAGWWTQGETPGTTGEWGVWRGAAPCGSSTPEEPEPDDPEEPAV